MTASLRVLRALTVALNIAANVVASTPFCHDCTRLNANEADTCNDFDPVVCCDNTDSNAQCTKEMDSDDAPCNSDFCDLQLPNAENSLLAPHDGLQYKLFDYNEISNYNYGLYLQWPEPLNTSMLECYQLSVRKRSSGPVSTGCRSFNDKQETIDKKTREFVMKIDYVKGVEKVQDFFVQVAAVPLFIWTLSFKVAADEEEYCLQGCPRCGCEPPPPPTNLNWSRSEDDPSLIILSWVDQGHSSGSVYYLHLNTSVNGKLLYRVEGKTSVMMTNLTGEVTAWLESYGCGCSQNTSEQITFTIDGPSTAMLPSQTPPVFTFMISISSSIAVSSTMGVPPPVAKTTVTPTFSDEMSSNLTTSTQTVVVIASVSVAVALFILALVLVSMMVLYRLRRVRNDEVESKEMQFEDIRTIDRPYENGTGSVVINSPVILTRTGPYVLLIFSQKTPQGDQDIIRSYGSKLNKTVTVKMYDVANRLTRTAWLEQNYEQASAILCVCNEALVMEWNNANSFAGGSIVSAVKMIVQGQIEHQTVPEKFAALFISKEDQKLTPPYLKNVRSFELCPENIESISRFALSMTEYKFQN